MTNVQFSGFKSPYDEEQALARHMQYLQAKSRTSKVLQDNSLNNFLGVQPLMQVPKTSAEILGDEQEVNRRVQAILTELFKDNPNLPFNPTTDTEGSIWARRNPSKFVFDQMESPDKVTLLEFQPEILAELKSFGLLTPTSFLTYIGNFRAKIAKSGGVKEYGTIKGVDEVKTLLTQLPQKADVSALKDSIRGIRQLINANSHLGGMDVSRLERRLDAVGQAVDHLTVMVPSQGDIQATQQFLADRIQRGSSVDETRAILDMYRHLPRAEDIREILRTLDAMERNRMTPNSIDAVLNRIEQAVGSISTQEYQQTRQAIEDMRKAVEQTNSFARQQSSISDVRLKAGIVDKIYEQVITEKLAERNAEVDAENALRTLRGESLQKHWTIRSLPPRDKADAKEAAENIGRSQLVSEGVIQQVSPFRADQVAAVYDPSAYATTQQSSSQGFGLSGAQHARRVRHKIQPKYTVMGKGINVDHIPQYVQFGKYALSMKHLTNGQLKLKHFNTLASVGDFSRAIDISDDFQDFIENFLDTEKINHKMLSKLPPQEQSTFKRLIKSSGLSIKYKLKDLLSNEEKEEEDRFNLVKSEFIAGNDSKQVKEELRRFLIKFMLENKINKRDGHELLFQLSM